MGKRIDEMYIGEFAEFEKTITETDVYMFSGITGDLNPIHINSEVANKSLFKGRVVHGVLSAGLISGVLGTKLPGIGTIYLSQELRFLKPVYINDTIKAKVELTEILFDKNIAVFKTTCINQNGIIVIDGVAKVMPPRNEEVKDDDKF